MNLIGQLKATSHEVDIIIYYILIILVLFRRYLLIMFITKILKIKNLNKFIRIHY